MTTTPTSAGTAEADARPAGAAGWRRLAGWGFAVAVFVFLGVVVGRDVRALQAHAWSVRPGLLALSLVVHTAGLAWGVRVWQLLLRRMGVRQPFLPLARVRLLAALGRYIPGKIWEFVGAAHLGVGTGIPVAVTLTSLVVYTGFYLTGALLVAVYLVPLDAIAIGLRLGELRWVAPLLLLAVHPAALGRALGLVRRLTRRDAVVWTGSWLDGIGFVALSAVGWLVTGAALHLFLGSLTPLPAAILPAVVGINAAAYVVGVAVFVAPAGLGAKEGAMAALLALFIPAPVAAVLAVASRVWTVVGELVPALLLLRPRPPAPPPA